MLTSECDTDLPKHLEDLQVHLKEGEWEINSHTVQGPDTDVKFGGVIRLRKTHMEPDNVVENILQQSVPMNVKQSYVFWELLR
jgi:hypothetical protein